MSDYYMCDCMYRNDCAYKMKGNCSLENEGIECPDYEEDMEYEVD